MSLFVIPFIPLWSSIIRIFKMFWDNCDLPNIDVRGLPLNMFWGAVYGVKAPRGYARLRGATSFIRAHLPGSRLGRDLEAKTGNKMVISSNFSKAPSSGVLPMDVDSLMKVVGAFLPWPKRRRKRERIWWREVKSHVWWEWWQLWQIRPQKERLLEQGQVRGQGWFIFQIDQQQPCSVGGGEESGLQNEGSNAPRFWGAVKEAEAR